MKFGVFLFGSLKYWLYLCKNGDIREDEFRKDKVTNPCQIALRESMVSSNMAPSSKG